MQHDGVAVAGLRKSLTGNPGKGVMGAVVRQTTHQGIEPGAGGHVPSGIEVGEHMAALPVPVPMVFNQAPAEVDWHF